MRAGPDGAADEGAVVVLADFESDFGAYLDSCLRAVGLSGAGCSNTHALCVRLLDAMSRRISVRPRRVERAKELTCPRERQAGLEQLLERARLGENLSPWQSTGIKRITTDPLLRALGVQHFHLGTALDKRGFAERTPELLFAHVTESHFYAIDVMQHGDWAAERLLEILHSNWPDVISDWQVKGAGPSRSFTEEDRLRLLKGNVNVFSSTPDGTTYFPIGGGVATSGVGIEAVRTCDYFLAHVRDLERQLKERPAVLIEAARSAGVRLDNPIHLRLAVEDDQFVAVEDRARVRFVLGPVP